jgi:hypothetical protein
MFAKLMLMMLMVLMVLMVLLVFCGSVTILVDMS